MAKSVQFIQKPYWSCDPSSTSNNAAVSLCDGMLEVLPGGVFALTKRPGLRELVNPGANVPGRGCHYSEKLDAFFFITGGTLWKYTQGAVAVTNLGGSFSLTNTTVFAEGQNLDASVIIYMADGGKLKYTDGTTVTEVTDPTAPVTVSSVVWYSNRFICNEVGTNRFYATGFNSAISEFDNTYWSSAFNPFAANIKADDCTALYTLGGELYVCGEEGFEIWQDDGVTPLIPVTTATLDTGLLAAGSITRADNKIYALVRIQGEIQVAEYTGRNYQPISGSIARQLNDLVEVSDAQGFAVFNQGSAFYVLNFPTENVTWAYDLRGGYWARWGYWQPEQGVYDYFIGKYAAFASKWGAFLVQSRFDSRIYEISRSFYSDGGYPMRVEYVTGNMDFGSYSRKRMQKLMIKMKAQEQIQSSMMLNWHDDGTYIWSNEIEVRLDSAAQKDSIEVLHRLGTFRTRQFKLTMSNSSQLTISGIDAQVGIMGN